MADRYTEVTHTGYGSRIGNSFVGALIGFVLFIGSFGLLYWNEGRTDMSQVAAKAEHIKSTGKPEISNGTLISLSAPVTAQGTLGDTFLAEGNYLALRRKVEMYSWIETKHTETKKEVGGGETKTTTYSYHKDWDETPANSSSFKHPEGHRNPSKPIDSKKSTLPRATMGDYSFDLQEVDLPDSEDLTLSKDNVRLSGGFMLADAHYLYKGSYSMDNPSVGDLRISYKVLKPDFDGTIFGVLDGNTVKPYTKDDDRLFRVFKGTREEAIKKLKEEHEMLTWILRLVGFLMMWGGMMLVVDPITTLLDVLPIAGSIGRFITGLVTFIAGLILSTVTIIISAVLHNIVALIITVVGAILLMIIVLATRKKKSAMA